MAKQTSSPIQPADSDERRLLWKRLADLEVAMLTTHDVDGTLTARPVRPVRVDPDGHLWIFTAIDGGIAADVRRDPEVHLSFVEQKHDLFVSLSGKAEVTRDPPRAREIWSTVAGAYFPRGPEDPNLAIVRVDVHRGDYWDVTDSKLVRFFKIAAAAATKTRPDDSGTHRRFTQ